MRASSWKTSASSSGPSRHQCKSGVARWNAVWRSPKASFTRACSSDCWATLQTRIAASRSATSSPHTPSMSWTASHTLPAASRRPRSHNKLNRFRSSPGEVSFVQNGRRNTPLHPLARSHRVASERGTASSANTAPCATWTCCSRCAFVIAMPTAPAALRSAFRASFSALSSRVAGGSSYSSRSSSSPDGSRSGRLPRSHLAVMATGVATLRKDRATSTRFRGSNPDSHADGGSRRASAGTRMTGARSPTATTWTSRQSSSRIPTACGSIRPAAALSMTAGHRSRSTTQKSVKKVPASSICTCSRRRSTHFRRCGRGGTTMWHGPALGPHRRRRSGCRATESSMAGAVTKSPPTSTTSRCSPGPRTSRVRSLSQVGSMRVSYTSTKSSGLTVAGISQPSARRALASWSSCSCRAPSRRGRATARPGSPFSGGPFPFKAWTRRLRVSRLIAH